MDTHWGHPRKAEYYQHRVNARVRGVAFELTFDEWLAIWEASGHLHERGRGRGKYCMARDGDKGPYAVGNVKIVLYEENDRERKPYWLGKKFSEETRRKISEACRGSNTAPKSAEHRRKIAEGVSRYWRSGQ